MWESALQQRRTRKRKLVSTLYERIVGEEREREKTGGVTTAEYEFPGNPITEDEVATGDRSVKSGEIVKESWRCSSSYITRAPETIANQSMLPYLGEILQLIKGLARGVSRRDELTCAMPRGQRLGMGWPIRRYSFSASIASWMVGEESVPCALMIPDATRDTTVHGRPDRV